VSSGFIEECDPFLNDWIVVKQRMWPKLPPKKWRLNFQQELDDKRFGGFVVRHALFAMREEVQTKIDKGAGTR